MVNISVIFSCSTLAFDRKTIANFGKQKPHQALKFLEKRNSEKEKWKAVLNQKKCGRIFRAAPGTDEMCRRKRESKEIGDIGKGSELEWE